MTQFTAQTIATYTKMWNAFQNGMITQCQWVAFCQAMLNITLMKNQAMLFRMQNNIMTHIQGNVK